MDTTNHQKLCARIVDNAGDAIVLVDPIVLTSTKT